MGKGSVRKSGVKKKKKRKEAEQVKMSQALRVNWEEDEDGYISVYGLANWVDYSNAVVTALGTKASGNQWAHKSTGRFQRLVN
jgi:hypothetical protein